MFDGLPQPICNESVRAMQTNPAIPARAKPEPTTAVAIPITEFLYEREYVSTTRSPLEIQGGIDRGREAILCY